MREALEEAASLREQADAAVARYDGITSELARLRLERHALTHEADEIPDRLHRARLDGLVPDSHGEDADALERRYIQVRERLPVATARIGKLEEELASLVAGGSRPAKVRNERVLLKHNARSPVLDALQEAVGELRDLHEQLAEVVPKASEDLIRSRDATRDGQNTLWGQAKAQR